MITYTVTLRSKANDDMDDIRNLHSFAQQAPAAATDVPEADGPSVVDVTPEVTAQPPAAEAAVDPAAADAARDLRIGLNPAVAGARPVRKVR